MGYTLRASDESSYCIPNPDLSDHPSVFSIIVVRSATLMMVGCHDGVMTCVDACNMVAAVGAWTSTSVNHERISSRVYVLVVGGGCHSHFNEPNYSPSPSNIIPLKLHGTDDRKTQGPRRRSRYPLTSSWPNHWRLLCWEYN